MNRQCYWYHCSNVFHGQSWTAKRKAPDLHANGEAVTPRLCVCPTVAECFSARLFTGGDVFVYRTAKPHRTIKPRTVWDHLITGERWLVPPVEMVFVSAIPADTVDRVQVASVLYHQTTWRNCDYKLRIAQLLLAVEHLPREFTSKQCRRFAKSLGRLFAIGDPEAYLLDRAITETQQILGRMQLIHG
jgi:hypothetical protein